MAWMEQRLAFKRQKFFYLITLCFLETKNGLNTLFVCVYRSGGMSGTSGTAFIKR